MKAAVVGGDMRQCYIAKTLTDYGYEAYMIKTPGYCELKDADVLVFKIPVSEEWAHIAGCIKKECILFGWNIPETLKCYKSYDFKDMEEVAVKNAVATAEGTIAEMIKNSEINIAGSNCLVAGFGRCGKAIAGRLKLLGAAVTVMVRSESSKEAAEKEGFEVSGIFERKSYDKYDFLINTIPARVINKDEIDKLKNDIVIIDIASKPGGVDFEYCKKKKIKALHCLGLPGIYSPKTSGIILAEAIRQQLKEG